MGKRPLLEWNFKRLILAWYLFVLICSFEYAEFGGCRPFSLSLFSLPPPLFPLILLKENS